MTGLKIIAEVAAERHLDPSMIVGTCRLDALFRARIEIARRLRERNWSTSRIGAALNRDHTTITFYLGRIDAKKPSLKRWHRPHIGFLKWAPRLQERPKRYLLPYAGADTIDYKWQARP